MKRKTLFNILAALLLMLATFASLNTGLSGSISMARRALAQEPGLEGPVLSGAEGPSSILAAVGTAFTYQGRLLDSDTPVDVACDFQFSLWDAASVGSQVGSTQTKTNVAVDDGYFSAPLDFGSSAFQGDARWLAISVACPTGGSYTTLSGRVALTAAPYAHTLRPGAVINGDSTGGILSVENTSTSGYGVYGKSGTASGKPTLFGVGVWGDGDSSVGVYGTSNSSGGVFGVSTSNSGVVGVSTSGNGVQGASTSGYGVYSDGDAHVEGDLTWKAKTSYVSVAAAAFHPIVDGYDYSNQGHTLWNNDGFSEYYVAPVQLPHGATVTELTFYWWDGSSIDGHCTLYRTDMTDSEVVMAEAWTSGDAATSDSSQDDTIVYATVDNSQYTYYLYWVLPDMVVAGHSVVIEYTFTEPY